MSIIITMMKNVAVVVDIITTMTKSMNTIMKQWSMSLCYAGRCSAEDIHFGESWMCELCS